LREIKRKKIYLSLNDCLSPANLTVSARLINQGSPTPLGGEAKLRLNNLDFASFLVASGKHGSFDTVTRNQELSMGQFITYIIPLAGVAALFLMFYKAKWVGEQDSGTDRMRKIGETVSAGAMAFLKAEYRVLTIFVFIVAVLLGYMGSQSSESSALPSSTKITSHPLVDASSTGRSASRRGRRLRASLNTGITTLSSMSGLVLTACTTSAVPEEF
jgi:hypothetical protein